MMIQHIPYKQTLLCYVVVESNLYFRYTIVLLHCIDTVKTRVVRRSFIMIHSFDRNGFLHVLFVVEIIQSPLWSILNMYLHTSQKCWERWLKISTTNKTCKKPLQSNEWININGLRTTLVITVLMQWSNTDA